MNTDQFPTQFGRAAISASARNRKGSNTDSSTSSEGHGFTAGALFNTKASIESYYDTSKTPITTYGAVIEKLRVNGLIEYAQTSSTQHPSTDKDSINSNVCRYLAYHTSGISYVKLPTDVRRYQVFEVTSVNNGTIRVYSPFTANQSINTPGKHNDHRNFGANAGYIYHDQYYAYITVSARRTERIQWTGGTWIKLKDD